MIYPQANYSGFDGLRTDKDIHRALIKLSATACLWCLWSVPARVWKALSETADALSLIRHCVQAFWILGSALMQQLYELEVNIC